MGHASTDATFVPLAVAVLTVSDTRIEADDESGRGLAERIAAAGHRVTERRIVRDDVYQLRAAFSHWIADPAVQVVIANGGTGLTGRDRTPEALEPLLDKAVPGFGELFRWLSYDDIGTSTVQSRAFAGIANATLLFCLPGSPKGCAFAWDRILSAQLDARTRPCNFVALLPRLDEQ